MSFNVVYTEKGGLPHDETEHGRNCWCCPDLLQPCPDCDVRLDDVVDEEIKPNPEELNLFKEAKARARPHCRRCSGFGLVKAFEPRKPIIIVHR